MLRPGQAFANKRQMGQAGIRYACLSADRDSIIIEIIKKRDIKTL